MGVIGLDVVRPGTSREALIKSIKGLGRLTGIAATRVAPPIARGIGGIVRRNPYAFAGLTLYEAERRGLLDEPIERAKDITADALYRAGEFLPDRTPQQMIDDMNESSSKPKRKVTKYNKSVKAGMAAAKASQYFGKKGTISKPKTAFKAVNSVASRINKGKKVSAKGATGKIARAIRRILK